MSPQAKPVDDTVTLNRLLQTLEEFRRLDPEMPIQRACYLLWTAVHQPCTQADVGIALRISEASRSRNKDILSDFGHGKTAPLGLIEAEANPDQRNENLLAVTGEGRRFLKRLVLKLTGGE